MSHRTTHNKYDKLFNSIAVLILITSAAQRVTCLIIRDTNGKITSTKLRSSEELVDASILKSNLNGRNC